MRTAGLGLAAALVALPFLPSAAGASPDLVPGFRSVVGSLEARAIWINPAAIGRSGRPTFVAEGAWREEAGSDDWDTTPAFGGVAASAGRSSYAFRHEGADREGVANWILSWGESRGVPGGLTLGATVNWLGGGDDKFDGTLGGLYPIGQSMTAGVVLEDLLEADVDGRPGARSWRTGLAWIPGNRRARVTWDTLWESDRVGETEHWFGVALDRTRHLRGGWYGDFDGAWSAAVGAVGGSAGLEVGLRRGPGEPDTAWLAFEWNGSRRPGGGWGPIPR